MNPEHQGPRRAFALWAESPTAGQLPCEGSKRWAGGTPACAWRRSNRRDRVSGDGQLGRGAGASGPLCVCNWSTPQTSARAPLPAIGATRLQLHRGDSRARATRDVAVVVRKALSRSRRRTSSRLPDVRETSSDAVGSSAAGTAQTRQHFLPRGGRLLVRASSSQRVCWRTYDRRAELAVWSCRVRRSIAARAASFSRPAG
jgi:hypothetical protein